MIRLPENKALRAGLFMVCAMGSFVCNDTIVKVVGPTLPTGELIMLRGIISLLIITAICHQQGVLPELPKLANKPVILRNTFDLISTVAFVTALMHMPIANLTAVMQAVPLAVTLLSMAFLGERVVPQRIIAVVLGFIGVLLIVKPSVTNANLYEGLALIIVFCVASRDLFTRRIPARIPTFLVALGNALFVTVGGTGLALVQGLQWPEPWQMGLLALAACFLSAGYLLMVATLRLGELSVTAPFRYSIMVFAIVSGILVFNQFPDLLATLGMVLIVGTGLFAARREAKAA